MYVDIIYIDFCIGWYVKTSLKWHHILGLSNTQMRLTTTPEYNACHVLEYKSIISAVDIDTRFTIQYINNSYFNPIEPFLRLQFGLTGFFRFK